MNWWRHEQVSISSTLFMRVFFVWNHIFGAKILCYSQNVTRKSCAIIFRPKKARVKRWWNWRHESVDFLEKSELYYRWMLMTSQQILDELHRRAPNLKPDFTRCYLGEAAPQTCHINLFFSCPFLLHLLSISSTLYGRIFRTNFLPKQKC